MNSKTTKTSQTAHKPAIKTYSNTTSTSKTHHHYHDQSDSHYHHDHQNEHTNQSPRGTHLKAHEHTQHPHNNQPIIIGTHAQIDSHINNPRKRSNPDLGHYRRKKAAQKQAELEILKKQPYHKLINYLTKKTHFDAEQVKSLLDIFKKLTSLGKMNRLRFRDMLFNQMGITDDIMLDRVFRAFDGDNEGSVTESEWIIGLSVMLRGELDEQIAYCYEVYDVNCDQCIGRDELHSSLRGCLYHIPGQNDDDLDLEDGTRELVELAMKKFDLDRDGYIKYREFSKAIHKDPILLQALGTCLPTNKAMMTFLSMIDANTRNYKTYLSHPLDSSWERESNKYDPHSALRNSKKLHEIDFKSAAKFQGLFHGHGTKSDFVNTGGPLSKKKSNRKLASRSSGSYSSKSYKSSQSSRSIF